MKKEDIPQDESTLQAANMTEVVYVTDENDNYTTANSIGWEVKNWALEESLSLINERIQQAKEDVSKGLVSPIVYYMELNKMDFKVLKAYVNFWTWTIKRHMKPNIFKKLSNEKLQKYADAFGITVEELKNFDGK